MADDLLNVLLALVAFFVPIGFAWFVVSRTARKHPHGDQRKVRKDPPMR